MKMGFLIKFNIKSNKIPTIKYSGISITRIGWGRKKILTYRGLSYRGSTVYN